MIWHKPIKLESLKLKLEQVKTWSNCTFFKMNLFNPSVWTPLSAHQGQILCHKTYASSIAIFLQTVSKMPAYLILHMWKSMEINKLKSDPQWQS